MLVRVHVQVRMVPVRGSFLQHGERGAPGGTGIDHGVRAAIVLRCHVHAMPMQRGGFAERIGDVDRDLLVIVQHDRRAKQGAVRTHGAGRLAGEEFHRSVLQFKVDHLPRDDRRYRQGILCARTWNNGADRKQKEEALAHAWLVDESESRWRSRAEK